MILEVLQQQTKQFLSLVTAPPREALAIQHRRYLENFLKAYFVTRNRRADAIDSSELAEAVEIGKDLFPLPIYGSLCIDGRVLPVLLGGFVANFGSFLQLPGGKITDFLQSNTSNSLFLPKNTAFAKMLDKAFQRQDTISQILDSHLACAAREGEERSKGERPYDHGLLADVIKKKKIAEAMLAYTRENFADKNIIPIQTNFDPHTGYMWMGLEKDDVLEEVQNKKDEHGNTIGFDEGTRSKLLSEKRVISTEALANDATIQPILETHAFEPNWEEEYHLTAQTFWRKMKALKENKTLIEAISKTVVTVFSHLAEKRNQAEREQRVMLLLASMFSGYVNRKNETGQYPYDKHTEKCSVVAAKKHGPFPPNVSAFVVHTDDADLPKSISLSIGIIRNNRKRELERYRNLSATARDGVESPTAVNAPVIVMVQEVTEVEQVSEDMWRNLEHIDWQDFPKDWAYITDNEFQKYLERKVPGISAHLARKINILRKKMTVLYDPKNEIGRTAVNNKNNIFVPTICDSSRRIRCIIPFFMNGYLNQEYPSAA